MSSTPITMARHGLLTNVTILAWLATVSAAYAEPKVGERVAVTACPYRGVVATCTMIAAADGTVFNISGTNPVPRLMGRMIWLRGTVTDKASVPGHGARPHPMDPAAKALPELTARHGLVRHRLHSHRAMR